jgi:hypothetical protein
MAKSKKKRRIIIWGSILIVLIIIRLLLPTIILHYANKTLANLKDYRGHVDDIDISLYRGAYQIDGFYLNKFDSATSKQTEFFKIARTDLSIHWDAILDGKIVGEITFLAPTLLFKKDKTEIQQVAKDTNDFRKVLKSFMPLKLNRVVIHKGSIHYIDETSSPKIDISMNETEAVATNLRNSEGTDEKLPSTLKANAKSYGGSLSLDMKLDGLKKQPTLDLTAEIENADLTKLNDFFKAYGKFDVSAGTLGLYTEFAAADGKFKGYVKPLIKGLKVVGPEDKKDKFPQKAKEAVFGLVGKAVTNPKKKQVATKVNIEGTFKETDVNTGEAIWELLRNAFIEALMANVDNEINIESAQAADGEVDKPGFFKRVFTSKAKREEKAEEQKKEELRNRKELDQKSLRRYSTNKAPRS